MGQEFCADLGFVDAGFTLRDATCCFVRSRMQAADECSHLTLILTLAQALAQALALILSYAGGRRVQ